MKYHTTKKAVMNGYSRIVSLPYCMLQNALTYFNPVAYCSRAEGWSCDIYDFQGVAISTGYAPFGNVKPEYELMKRYDKKARATEEKNYKEYRNKKKAMYRIVIDFINDVTGYHLSRTM